MLVKVKKIYKNFPINGPWIDLRNHVISTHVLGFFLDV